MILWHRLASIVKWIVGRERAEQRLDEELRAYVDLAAADKIRDGVPAEARLAVMRLVLARVTLLVGVGIVVGLAIASWASRFVASLLYGLEPGDPATLAAAAATLAVIGAIAGWLPAHRASRLDPTQVLSDM